MLSVSMFFCVLNQSNKSTLGQCLTICVHVFPYVLFCEAVVSCTHMPYFTIVLSGCVAILACNSVADLFMVELFVNTEARLFCVFRSTPKSRPNNMGLRYPSVRPSTKSFSNSDEIWYVGRGR